MRIIKDKIKLSELEEMAKKMFGNLIKVVVDAEKEIMAVDAEMHADEEQALIEQGSKQYNLWGINLYPEFLGQDDFVEFDSMINLRPSRNNKTRGIDDEKLQQKILKIVNKLVEK